MKENNLTGEEEISITQLKEEPIWTNWTYYTTKNGNTTKRPLSKVNDPTTWVTYREADNRAKWSKEAMGVGIIFASHSSGLAICGIDIDAHNVNTNPLSAEILAMFSDTYIEQSPSGKGYHILFLAELSRIPKSYKQIYKQKNSELDVECYISGMTNRYFTFTGNQKSDNSYLINKTDTLLEFLNKYMKLSSSPVSLDTQIKLTERGETGHQAIDVQQRLEIAMNAHNGVLFSALFNGDTSAYNSPSEAVQALVDMLVFYFGDGGKSLVKDVYMRSGLATGKWAERSEIINTTISNAFQRVTNRYTTTLKKEKKLS